MLIILALLIIIALFAWARSSAKGIDRTADNIDALSRRIRTANKARR